MTNAFVQSMARNYDDALRLMEAALTDCPDRLWETDLWPDEAPTGPGLHGGLHGSAPWFLAYHALSCLDYDLAGEFEPWAPPQPFDESTWSFPNRMFTKAELLGYIDYCRGRVRRTLDALTEDTAARPLPGAHRYHGTLFGVLVGSIPLHVIEHASQIRQFLTAAGVKQTQASSEPRQMDAEWRRAAAYVVCRDDAGRILLTRFTQAGHPDSGKWTMPGGAMEWGEDPLETAERELEEETGLHAEIGRVVGVFSRWYEPHEAVSGNAGHVVGIVYEGTNVRGVLRTEFSRDATNTTDAAAWFTLEEARTLPHVGLVTYCLDLCD